MHEVSPIEERGIQRSCILVACLICMYVYVESLAIILGCYFWSNKQKNLDFVVHSFTHQEPGCMAVEEYKSYIIHLTKYNIIYNE